MNAYKDFAMVYDTFMDNAPYDKWLQFLIENFNKYKVPKELILDLGCGTGTLTQMLSKNGYDMIGVDNSDEMLSIAIQKGMNDTQNILYLLQDMREFELYGTVRAVISICDSINYLLEEEDIVKTFSLINNYLDPGGIFIFDFNTVYKYESVIGDATIAENRDTCSFIWENYYHTKEHINEYDLTIFVKEENERYRRFNETHYQRGYTVREMEEFLYKAGLILLETLDSDTNGPVSESSERVYMIARESGKNLE